MGRERATNKAMALWGVRRLFIDRWGCRNAARWGGGGCIMGTTINALHLLARPLPAMADNIGSGHGIVVLVDICFGGIGIVELGGGINRSK